MRGRTMALAALVAVAVAAMTVPVTVTAQQVADTAYRPDVAPPAFPDGEGPRVLIDGAHHNFHTVDGRYAPFAAVLRRDGYRVRGVQDPVTAASLADADVLVVSNALHARNLRDWSLPTPSAFTAEEIGAIRRWVEAGGGLLLIADHMPFPGATDSLAAAFGFEFRNGFALDTLGGCVTCPIVFRRHADPAGAGGGVLADHVITRGTRPGEAVDSVATFTGQAFLAPDADPLLILGPGAIQLLPTTAWEFDDDTETEPADGYLQGAVKRVGLGRVAVFGEAAQFTAQRGGPDGRPMGMNVAVASQNAQFLLNVMHWLTAGGGP